MAVLHEINVKLSEESFQYIQEKIAAGEYSSESEVLEEGVESLQLEAMDRERFEREVVRPAHDYLLAHPESAITDEELGAMLEERRRMRRKTG